MKISKAITEQLLKISIKKGILKKEEYDNLTPEGKRDLVEYFILLGDLHFPQDYSELYNHNCKGKMCNKCLQVRRFMKSIA